MHPKFTIGYSRRGNTNKVYVQRSKKKLTIILTIITQAKSCKNT